MNVPRWTTSQPEAYTRVILPGRETPHAEHLDKALHWLTEAIEILDEQARCIRVFQEHVRNGEIYYGQHETPKEYGRWLDPYLRAMKCFHEESSRAFKETELIRNTG